MLSDSPRKSAKTADDSILVIIGQAGKVGRRGSGGVPSLGGLQSDLRLTLCPHKSRPHSTWRPFEARR